jgi:cephalosporin-C deacetylase
MIGMKLGYFFRIVVMFVALSALATPLFAQSSDTVSLDGTWLTLPGDDIHRGGLTYKESSWQTTTLPAPTANSGFVWYRKHFIVPADWENDPIVVQKRQLFLHLGAFRGAINVYLNGFHVQSQGTTPSDSKGSGYSAGPIRSDVAVAVASEALVGGQNIDLFNFGKDNVIAFEVYADASGEGFTGGDITVQKPGLSYFYPYSRTLSSDGGLFDTQHPISFQVTLGNRTNNSVEDTLAISVADDQGAPPAKFVPSSKPVDIDPKTEVTVTSGFALDAPGFYTVSVKVSAAGKPLPDDDFVVGYNALDIIPSDTRPAEFHPFWAEVIKDASAIASPELSNEGSNYTLTGLDGKSFSGWMTLPAKVSGPVPIVVEFPPYNSDFTGPDKSLSSSGIATLCVNVDTSFVGPGTTPITSGVDDPKTYAYRTIIGNALAVVDTLSSIPQIDKTRVGVAGVDQGASTAITVAALLPSSVKAVFAADPLFGEPAHSLKSAQSGPYTDLRDYVATHPAASKTLSYFDIANLVPAMAAPIFLQMGLMDTVTPPYGIFAAANEIRSNLVVAADPNAEHATTADLAAGYAWLSKQL